MRRSRDQSTAKKPRTRKSAAVPFTPDAPAPRATPAITTALRRGVRHRRSGVPAQQQEELLPPELLQLVGATLEPADLASASLVCKLWSRALRAVVTSLCIHLHPDAVACHEQSTGIAKGFPHLTELHLQFGARCDTSPLNAFCSTFPSMARLRKLRLTSWVPYAPQKGLGTLGHFPNLELGGLTSLVVDGAAMSSNEMLGVINSAATATNLASLSLTPNVWPYFTQLDPFQVPAWLQPATAGIMFTGVPRMPSASAATLLACKLPGLQHLAISVDYGSQCDFFSEMQRLTALNSLDLLSGAPVQSRALQALSSLTSLRELRLAPALGSGPEALEEHSLLTLTQLQKLGVRLSRRPAEPLCRDLTALTRRRAGPALIELELSRCVWSAEAGACIAALTSLTRLRLERLECVRPARASASASRAAMSVDLQPLMALRGMRRFELVVATGNVAGIIAGLGRLWAAWAPTLEDVRLVDLSVTELDPWATLPALGECGALTSLRLLLREPMSPEVGVVDVGRLPPRLSELALRHVVVTADEATEHRMTALASLSLRQCTVIPPDGLPGNALHSGATLRPDGVHWHVPLLSALPALRSVELVAMPYLRDADFAGIGALTALTSLLICASGTIEVTHAGLQALGGLKRLRQLRWHVGDVTDLLPDVAPLKSMERLVALHLPSYLHGQFARWSAYNALPPLADVHVEMPLP